MDPRIADYIRENRRRYTREAITTQLLAAGHDPGEIERVWAALDASDPDEVAGEGFWGRFALILLGINLAVFLAVGLLTGMLADVAWSGTLLVILAIAMGIGALISWGIVAATGPTKLSPTTALVVGAAIPALFALLIGGACFALVGAVGGPPVPPSQATMETDLGPPLNVSQVIDGLCHPNGPDPADGFSVNGGGMREAGQMFDVSIGAYPRSPGGPLEVEVWISSSVVDKAEEGYLSWGTEGPSRGDVDVVLDGMSGTVTFTGLPAMQDGPGGARDAPLSGEISWTCR